MRTGGHFTLTLQTDETTISQGSRPDTLDVVSIAVNAWGPPRERRASRSGDADAQAIEAW